MAEIYRQGQDIYDAQTNKRIPDVATLQRDYAGAREVSGPGATDIGGVPTTAGSTPAIVRPGQYGMSDWRSYQALRDAAAEVIKIRQQGNKDIIEPTSYWKGQMRGASDPMAQDTQLRELSPADQAGLRMSGRATASAALSSLDDERQYRERIAGTQLQTLDSMYANQQKERDMDLTNTYRNRQLDETKETNQIQANIRAFEAGMPLPYPGVGGHQSSSGQDGGESDSSKVFTLGGVTYDLTKYAKDPNWGTKIRSILESSPDYSVKPSNVSSRFGTSFDQYIYNKKKDSKLVGQGETIYNTAVKNGIDPNLMFSIIMLETGWGTSDVLKNNKNLGGITWNKNFPESWKGSPRPSNEGGNYVNFPTWEDAFNSQAATIKSKISAGIQPSVNNTITVKNNSLSKSEMEDLSFATGIGIGEIAALQPNEVRALEVKVKSQGSENKTAESHADSSDGKKIQTTFGLSREEAVLLFQAIAGGITDSERSELNKAGVSNGAIDAAIEISTYGSISSGFGSKIVK